MKDFLKYINFISAETFKHCNDEKELEKLRVLYFGQNGILNCLYNILTDSYKKDKCTGSGVSPIKRD